MTQDVRPSQFILVYGPGAILEGEDGPRMIPEARIGLFGQSSGFRPQDYRIDDQRMSKGLLKGCKIYRLPTNPELGHDGAIYSTNPFPLWKLCSNQGPHGGGSLLYREDACPVCKDPVKGGGKQAVRFVMACRDGHLDEIPWNFMVHDGACSGSRTGSIHPDLRGDSIRWHLRGGTLSDIELECPRCGTTKSFGEIYYLERTCSGRHPQREYDTRPRTGTCDRKAKVIMRQAANLRLAETRTLLSIQSTNTVLHRYLENEAVAGFMAASGHATNSKEGVLNMLRALHDKKLVGMDAVEEFGRADWDEIRQAIKDSAKEFPETYHGLIMDELDELFKASEYGAPPQGAKKPKAKAIFEVNVDEKKPARTEKGTKFRITPIQTLRTVTVQTGFRRDMPERNETGLPKLVGIKHVEQNGTWLPGVEFLGEGLFVCRDADDGWADCPKGEHAGAWSNGAQGADAYFEAAFRDAASSRDELDPGFVWWHTLSHLLIRAIGEEAGYSPASIRERVYFERDGGRCRGGILLYATQPGNEGTLGGLVGLAPHMEKILRAALEKAASCSGDPLCGDAEFSSGGYSGASCYACLMTSETSCEHRNMWLDRHVLTDNMP